MTTERLIEKIKKLLALSQSPNEHEATEAAAKAANLMQEHQIVEAQLRIDDGEAEPEPILEGYGVDAIVRMPSWRRTLASGCAVSTGAHMWSQGIRIDGKNATELKLFGRKSAVQTAAYQYQYLAHEIERLAHIEYCASGMKENSKSWKNSFCYGAAERIYWRLKTARYDFELRSKGAATGTALAIIETDQSQVDANWKKKTAGWGTCSVSAPSSTRGYAAGQAKGGTMNLGGGGKGIGAPAKQIGK